MQIDASKRVVDDIRRVKERFCRQPDMVPCLGLTLKSKTGEETFGPEFRLGAIKRLAVPGTNQHEIIDLAGIEVALIVPPEFYLLDSVYLDYVDNRIFNIN